MDYKIFKDIEIRFSDIDALGHVNNASYLSYMEDVRLEYMKSVFAGLNYQTDFSQFPVILGDVYCRYESPAFLGEHIRVYTKVTHFGRKSFSMDYTLIELHSQRVLATAKTTMVMYDLKTKSTYDIPDFVKERVQMIENGRVLQK